MAVKDITIPKAEPIVLEEFTISNSKAKTFRRCPNQYRYKYVGRLRAKKKSVQLERGSWVHECLMYHYDGEDWRVPHEEYCEKFYNQYEETREEWGDLPGEVERIMLSYLRTYRDEDKHYKTIDSELDEIMTLPNGLRFRFIIDQIYEDSTGGLWLRDHKTTGGDFFDWDFMIRDAQLVRYFWCAVKMGYTPLRGIEFNEISTKPPTVPKLLKSGLALERRKNIACDYWTYLKEIKRHGFEPREYLDILRILKAKEEKFFRRTRMPMDEGMMRQMMLELSQTSGDIFRAHRRNEFPRTPDKSCKWGCDFKDLCTVELQGGDTSSVIRHGFTRTPESKEVQE